MPGYSLQSRVAVYPFDRRADGDTATIGDPDREVYLVFAREGLEILDWLAAGRTIGESAREYEQRHGQQIDVLDFVAALEAEGFVAAAADELPQRPLPGRRSLVDFSWLSPATARLFVSAPVLALAGAIIGMGACLVITQPSLIPASTSLVYHDHFAAFTWITVFFTLLGVLLHELGHVVAARAVGVPAKLCAGNQMYVLVAQTSMNGMWLVPKRKRYLAFVFGTVIDSVTAAVLIGLRWADGNGWIHLLPSVAALTAGVLVTYYTRIVWQLFFFLRTDGYYVISTLFDCRSLLSDTEDYLWNLSAKVRRSRRLVDQSAIPARELRVIRRYSIVWILGRIVSLSAFLFVGVPVLWAYLYQVTLLIIGQPTRFSSLDFVTIFVISLLFDFTGLVMWVRHLYRAALRRRRLPTVPTVPTVPTAPAVPAERPAALTDTADAV
ncbi:hypothetical protein [Jatrophihabitans sp.]|uniref:hypothetical protein n=1 Tax=Jatrophihabitans sp. TaxID=1932789 RepID=UPI002EE2D36F